MMRHALLLLAAACAAAGTPAAPTTAPATAAPAGSAELATAVPPVPPAGVEEEGEDPWPFGGGEVWSFLVMVAGVLLLCAGVACFCYESRKGNGGPGDLEDSANSPEVQLVASDSARHNATLPPPAAPPEEPAQPMQPILPPPPTMPPPPAVGRRASATGLVS